MAKLILVVAMTLLVAACDRFPGFPPNETGLLKYDWVPADPRPAPAPLYCYATLATPECFAKPIPGRPVLGNYGALPGITVTPVAPVPQADAAAAASPVPAPASGKPQEDRVQAVPLTPVEKAPVPITPAPQS